MSYPDVQGLPRPTRSSRSGFPLGLLLTCIGVFIISVWAFLGNSGDAQQYSAKATATVTAPGVEHEVMKISGIGRSGPVTYCAIPYRFTDAAGLEQIGTYSGRADCTRASYQPGATRTAYYDPDNSSDSTLRNAESFWLNLFFIALMGVSIALGALAISWMRRARQHDVRPRRTPIPRTPA